MHATCGAPLRKCRRVRRGQTCAGVRSCDVRVMRACVARDACACVMCALRAGARMIGALRRVSVRWLDVVRGVAWCACCETLQTRLPCVFHGLNSQEKLDSCRSFCACNIARVPLGSRLARFLHTLARWTLHGSILATYAGLAALVPSVFHSFSSVKKSLIVAIWCKNC